MKPLRTLALLVVCAALTQAQDTKWTYSAESQHYTLQATIPKDKADPVLKYMDLCFETYRKFLNPAADRLPKKKFALQCYKDKAEYKAAGGPGRYGHYDGKRLVGYYDPEQMLPTFAHEGMHQFTDICIPNFERLPAWYSEGIAECIANNEVRGGKLYMCLKKGPVPKIRVYVAQDAIKDGTFIKLKDLLVYDKRKFQENHKLCYAESWFLCHFLLTFPKQDDPSRQIPDGKYKQVIVKFHNAMLDPKMKVEEAVKLAFVLNGKALDMEKLEEEFKEYIKSFEAERPAEDP